ncbi:MAG: competence/damage-inducible protein A, partial [Armatimonadetes bacterium]|nr:competence/damage-inducible protein A [Armatimonadota bacterium]
RAAGRADLIITSGGLGPTQDDLTKEAIAEAFAEELILDDESLQHVTSFFARRGIPMPERNRKQALIYRSGRPIPNPNGTAPGALLEKDGKIVISLPGPPRELVPMVEDWLVPYLTGKLGGRRQYLRSRVLRFFGIGESALEERVQDLLAGANPTVAPLAHTGEVHLRLTAKAGSPEEAQALIAPVEAEIRSRAGQYLYGTDETTLEEATVKTLIAAVETVAVAESCTGGLLGTRITNVPGSSATFLGGVICYSDDVKVRLCEVPEAVLVRHGAVSEACAHALAEGIRRVMGADIGASITGIAGPEGGTPEKPVGLVYVGLATAGGTRVERHLFMGQRPDIRFRSTHVALDMIRRAAAV